MATHHHHFHPLHHHHNRRHHPHLSTHTKFQSLDSKNPVPTTSFSLKPTPIPPISASSTTPTPTTASPSTSTAFSLDLLHEHLAAQNFRQADEETRRLLIVLAGEAAVKRGYVFFSEVQFISKEDLKAIDELWRKYSDNRFGYSVQKRIWQAKANKDFTNFFIKVGWMKKLDTEVEQYNYRAFPNEFMWELSDDTPEGHLPLTNALRGTQLLNCILSHPAFDDEVEEDDEDEGSDKDQGDKGGLKPLGKTIFKTNYSF